MTHTPGPWASDEMIHNMMEFRVYSSTGKVIARVQDFTTFREDVEEADANARLIAAAPELLKALKGIIDAADDPDNEKDSELVDQIDWTGIRQAIAKAEGRA